MVDDAEDYSEAEYDRLASAVFGSGEVTGDLGQDGFICSDGGRSRFKIRATGNVPEQVTLSRSFFTQQRGGTVVK